MRRYVLSASAALAAAVLFAGPALAQPGDTPVSGDDRATAHSGNVVGKDCAELFPGSTELASGKIDFSVDDSNTYIDITGLDDGVTLSGIVVKGGPAYNVYEPGDLGDLPWLDLHSPLVPSGKPAQISHWFACGSGGSETTTTTPPTETTTTTDTSVTETTTSDSSVPSTTRETESSSGGVTVTTTTSADVSPVADDEDLASTGFNGGWLIALAALLLVGGTALLVIVRLRAARR